MLSRRNDTDWSLVGKMRVGKMSLNLLQSEDYEGTPFCTVLGRPDGHCMLPYIRDQILELAKESLLVVLL